MRAKEKERREGRSNCVISARPYSISDSIFPITPRTTYATPAIASAVSAPLGMGGIPLGVTSTASSSTTEQADSAAAASMRPSLNVSRI